MSTLNLLYNTLVGYTTKLTTFFGKAYVYVNNGLSTLCYISNSLLTPINTLLKDILRHLWHIWILSMDLCRKIRVNFAQPVQKFRGLLQIIYGHITNYGAIKTILLTSSWMLLCIYSPFRTICVTSSVVLIKNGFSPILVPLIFIPMTIIYQFLQVGSPEENIVANMSGNLLVDVTLLIGIPLIHKTWENGYLSTSGLAVSQWVNGNLWTLFETPNRETIVPISIIDSSNSNLITTDIIETKTIHRRFLNLNNNFFVGTPSNNALIKFNIGTTLIDPDLQRIWGPSNTNVADTFEAQVARLFEVPAPKPSIITVDAIVDRIDTIDFAAIEAEKYRLSNVIVEYFGVDNEITKIQSELYLEDDDNIYTEKCELLMHLTEVLHELALQSEPSMDIEELHEFVLELKYDYITNQNIVDSNDVRQESIATEPTTSVAPIPKEYDNGKDEKVTEDFGNVGTNPGNPGKQEEDDLAIIHTTKNTQDYTGMDDTRVERIYKEFNAQFSKSKEDEDGNSSHYESESDDEFGNSSPLYHSSAANRQGMVTPIVVVILANNTTRVTHKTTTITTSDEQIVDHVETEQSFLELLQVRVITVILIIALIEATSLTIRVIITLNSWIL